MALITIRTYTHGEVESASFMNLFVRLREEASPGYCRDCGDQIVKHDAYETGTKPRGPLATICPGHQLDMERDRQRFSRAKRLLERGISYWEYRICGDCGDGFYAHGRVKYCVEHSTSAARQRRHRTKKEPIQ